MFNYDVLHIKCTILNETFSIYLILIISQKCFKLIFTNTAIDEITSEKTPICISSESKQAGMAEPKMQAD